MVVNKKDLINTVVFLIVGFLALATGHYFNEINRFITGGALVLVAIVLYFYIALTVARKNWLDLRAVFSGVWLATIGLASLRLTAYQEPWQKKTWVLFGVAYLVFQIGGFLGEYFGGDLLEKLLNKLSQIKTKKISFKFHENRLFIICVVTTLIGLACFITNVVIKGYIPCFSKSPMAYVDFYTKFHIFSVASTVVCGLCYYCIKTQALSVVKKIILWICILYLLILFPIMIVSRGVFVSVALYFTAVVFYLNKRRFIALVLCLVTIFGVYMGASELRNFTDSQLSVLFEPVEIGGDKDDDTELDENDQDQDQTDAEPGFALSPKMAFLYGYLTVGHDNFNEAVQNLEEYTWGAKTAKPFNVILRLPLFNKLLQGVKSHFVRPHLNTNNFLGDYYYDFHEWGVAVLVLLLALAAMSLQKYALKTNSVFFVLALGIVFYAVFLVFFTNMVSQFEFWVFLGVILICAVITNISLNTKKTN